MFAFQYSFTIMELGEKLATGHEDIDEQHRDLLHCLSELRLATTEQRFLLAFHCIAKLKRFVRNHFVTEEALMRSCGFPRLDEHLREHEEFYSCLRKLEERSFQMDVSTEMVEFLSEWLVNHVFQADMDYVPYLKGVPLIGQGPSCREERQVPFRTGMCR